MSGTIAVEEHSKCVTYNVSSSRSRNYRNKTVTITVRVPVWLYERLKEKGIYNISKFVRKLLLVEIEGKLTREQELEAELEQLTEEMDKLQKHHSTLLKHGSYAKIYVENLKDGTIVTHNPFRFSKPGQLALSKEEKELVDEAVKLREELNKQYKEKLREWLALKEESIKKNGK
ncbi:MAG: hypothetical protein QXX92_00440 [Candidatus Bathyarchaeia archaeon]